jgi:hypothetical protein
MDRIGRYLRQIHGAGDVADAEKVIQQEKKLQSLRVAFQLSMHVSTIFLSLRFQAMPSAKKC